MESVNFQREKLYEKVWTKPITELAKEYGIHAYQLTKVCEELDIPRPDSGYWSKIRHGKKVKMKPLINSEKNEYRLSRDKTRPFELDKLLPQGYRDIIVKEQLRNPHPLVHKTHKYLKERLNEGSTGGKYGRLKPFEPGYLNISVSKDSLKRSLKILDAILKESIRQGFQVGTGTRYDRYYTYIQVREDKAYISLQEEGKRTKNKNPKYSWEEYDYYTTGKLKLMISSSFYGYTSRRISDTKTKVIEERLNKFFPILLEIVEEEKKNRINREEADRKAQVRRKIREQEEREHQAEMNRRVELEQLSERFTKSEYIYQFIGKVEAELKHCSLSQKQNERLNDWKKWAFEHADRLNPVKQLIDELLKTRE